MRLEELAMSIEENKRIILGFFENLSAGNGEAILGALADSATWWVQGNFQLSGTKSKKEFAALVGDLGAKIDGGLRVTPKGITAEGERVAVEAESYAKMKNGKTYQNTYHFLFIVRDGKIQSVKEYLDTIHANAVLCS
jgi:ketosteroid isomerase-like protein